MPVSSRAQRGIWTCRFLAALGMTILATPALAQNPIKWSLRLLSKGEITAGKTFDAGLSATIDKSWHLYSLTPVDSGPQPTTIALIPNEAFSLASDVASPMPLTAFDPNFNRETEFFKDKVTFLVPVQVAKAAPNGNHKLQLTVMWQTCNDRFCLPPAEALVTLEVSVGPRAVVADKGERAGGREGGRADEGGRAGGREGESVTEIVGADSVALAGGVTGGMVLDMAAAARTSTLAGYLGLAMLMGALSLLTPCVFPMVPITVSYFTNTARGGRRDAGVNALIYGAGIILTFSGLGFLLAVVFGASGLTRFAADPWLNLAITAMFVAFAMSLFGVKELTLPSKVLTAASMADAGKGRIVGTLLMGLAFTLTSFTCTAPFLGTLLVVASQGEWQWPLMGMLAFSSVFALPFIILAFVPQVVASLPRSGPWLVAVKAVMGILELAAAMKFLSNADLVWGWGIFTRPVVLASWVILAIVLAAYLAGAMPLGHAARLGRATGGRYAVVLGTLLLAGWLGSGLMGRRLGELEAFLPPADGAHLSENGELPWIVNDYTTALAQASSAGGQRVLIDFTGYTCTNCRWMEANMFPKTEVARELSRYVRVRLYTDGRGEPYRGFQRMEQRLFGTVALPYYAVMTAEGKPVVAFGGLTRNSAEYLAFLRRGLE
jgi:thiol:disulfide interchange protein